MVAESRAAAGGRCAAWPPGRVWPGRQRLGAGHRAVASGRRAGQRLGGVRRHAAVLDPGGTAHVVGQAVRGRAAGVPNFRTSDSECLRQKRRCGPPELEQGVRSGPAFVSTCPRDDTHDAGGPNHCGHRSPRPRREPATQQRLQLCRALCEPLSASSCVAICTPGSQTTRKKYSKTEVEVWQSDVSDARHDLMRAACMAAHKKPGRAATNG